MKNHVVITGAAGGLGLAAANEAVRNGWTVFALDYNQEALDAIQTENIIPIVCDITNTDSVKNAVDTVRQYTHELQAIVNFAGILEMGSVIELPVENLQRVLNINLVGMYQINQQFFSLIQKGKGRIINVSSETGVLSPAPFSGFYYLSKHAVETYSDALRRELSFLNIPVITIRPGAFKTKLQSDSTDMIKRAKEKSVLFKKELQKGIDMAANGSNHAKDASVLAKVVYKALTDKRPRLKYSSNLNYQFILISMLPERLQDWIYKKALGT